MKNAKQNRAIGTIMVRQNKPLRIYKAILAKNAGQNKTPSLNEGAYFFGGKLLLKGAVYG